MSSNDQLVITKKKGMFEIHHNLCIDNPFTPNQNSLLGVKKTLIKAIKFAKKICCEYPYVEYGYDIYDNCLKEAKNVKS